MAFQWKIAQLDNVADLAFNYAKALRKAGVQSDLLVEKGSLADPAAHMKERHAWVKYWPRSNPARKYAALKKMAEPYDLLHAHGGIAAYAQFFGKPFIFHSMGSDLRLVARFRYWSSDVKSWVPRAVTGVLLRRAFRRCDAFFYSQPDQVDMIRELRVRNPVFVLQIIDTDAYRPFPAPRAAKRAAARSATQPLKPLIFFYPTRHSWTTKGNDRLFRAFARFLRQCPDARLVSTYWDIHKEKSKALVRELGIEKSVEFIPFLDQKGMKEGYHACDVVVDEFNLGSFGPGALEAMACEKPVLRYIDTNLHKQLYRDKGALPIENARSEDEIYRGLLHLSDRKVRERMGKRARAFILKHHHWKKVTARLISEYEKILRKHSKSKKV